MDYTSKFLSYFAVLDQQIKSHKSYGFIYSLSFMRTIRRGKILLYSKLYYKQ